MPTMLLPRLMLRARRLLRLMRMRMLLMIRSKRTLMVMMIARVCCSGVRLCCFQNLTAHVHLRLARLHIRRMRLCDRSRRSRRSNRPQKEDQRDDGYPKRGHWDAPYPLILLWWHPCLASPVPRSGRRVCGVLVAFVPGAVVLILILVRRVSALCRCRYRFRGGARRRLVVLHAR